MKLFPFICLFIIIAFIKLIFELKFLEKRIVFTRIYLFSIVFFIFFIAILTGDWMIGFRLYLPGLLIIFIYCSEPLFNYSSRKINRKLIWNKIFNEFNFLNKKIQKLRNNYVVENQSLQENYTLRVNYVLNIRPDFFYDVDGIQIWEQELKNHAEFNDNYIRIYEGLYVRNDVELSEESLLNLPILEYQNKWKPFL